MRKINALFAALLLIIGGCSTDNNGNTIDVPLAPTNLTATVVSASQVNLQWVDNASNETGYKVQRKTSGGFTDVASTGAGIVTFSDMNVSPGISYTYRVFAYNGAGTSLVSSNEVTVTTTLNLPDISTAAITAITYTTAVSGGNIIINGAAAITSRGVCWSTSAAPTTALPTKTSDGSGDGSFTSNITGLTAGTMYYIRAYATNANGTVYGNELSFTTPASNVYYYIPGPNVTDIDGNTYPSITTSCGQTWTAQNLTVSRYRNGDIIPKVTDSVQWGNLTTGAWCWYKNDSVTYAAIYGKLYNSYAVNDPRGLAPQGWHMPTDAEWNKLTICIDPNADTTQCCYNFAGPAMKSTNGWIINGNATTNSSGFAGLPGGLRVPEGYFVGGGVNGDWWSASEFGTLGVWGRSLNFDNSYLNRSLSYKTYGLSVRVVRD